MANISDIIEEFLLETMGENEKLVLSRNELATFFSCAPSQINYVLSTRFTPERGFVIDSRRGGGGFITVVKLTRTPEEAYGHIIDGEAQGLSFIRAAQVVDRMCEDDLITVREAQMLKTVLSDKALIAPTIIKDVLRMNILKSVLMALLRMDLD